MEQIDIEVFKNEWFSFEEIESIKRWINDIENWKTISFEEVKLLSRKKLFSNSKTYA
jgi:hypothetical protein